MSLPRILLASVILVSTSAVQAKSYKADRPNIVFILADDLGYGDLGCYGSKSIRTPHCDRLAQQGVRLTDAYAAAPVCSPTRAALITGQYPQRHGFDWVIRYTEKERGLPASGPGLAKQLRSAGYATGLFGKWHLGYKPEFAPNAHGFDRFFGFLAADLDFYAHRDALGDQGLYENTKLIERPGYLTDLITDEAVAFIEAKQIERFFVEIAYNAPHWPFQPPDRPDDIRNKRTYGPETGTRADYIKMVERLDQGVGRILDTLDRLGLAHNTIVVFTGDNGGERLSDNGPLFHGKYTLWEGGLRVPALVRWPDHIPANSVSAQPTITMDWTTSLIKLAGADWPRDVKLDGEDILPVLTGQQRVHTRTLCWRLPRPSAQYGQMAIRHDRWKLINDRDTELLFDLSSDIGERKNLAAQHPQRVKEMGTLLEQWDRTLPTPK